MSLPTRSGALARSIVLRSSLLGVRLPQPLGLTVAPKPLLPPALTPLSSPVAVVALIIMLSIIPSTMSYQAPLVARSVSTVQMSAITPGDIGTTKPLGVYDPLQLMTKNPEKYRRFQEMEIKHGRMSMAACAHVFVVGAGFKFPGYISYLSFPPLKFEDIPASPVASWETLPQAGWAQIVCLIAIIDNSLVREQQSNSVAG